MQKVGVMIVIATFALAATVLYISSLHPFTPSQEESTVKGINCTSYTDSFTIIATESGYNDSIGHGAPAKSWPILCAQSGEVTIKVINEDTVEPHGFAVAGYLPAGITVLPGKTDTITFYAGSTGDYKVYCNVICAIHTFMQSGVLVVA
jgi:heme/copper-type cytochrome/quinol oxidase subunit 2